MNKVSNEYKEAQKVQRSDCGCGSSHTLKPRRLQAASRVSRRNNQRSIKTRFL